MTLLARFKGSFLSGLLLIAPLVVTLYVLRILVNWLFAILDPIARGTGLTRYAGPVTLGDKFLAGVLLVCLITLLGGVARNRVGGQLFGGLGRVITIVPLVSTVYGSVRQVASALGDRESRYDRVVLVEYPRRGSHVLGLVTGPAPDATREAIGDDHIAVFVPNSPNPTGGRLLFLPPDEVTEIDASVRSALRTLVTTGIGADDDESIGSTAIRD